MPYREQRELFALKNNNKCINSKTLISALQLRGRKESEADKIEGQRETKAGGEGEIESGQKR